MPYLSFVETSIRILQRYTFIETSMTKLHPKHMHSIKTAPKMAAKAFFFFSRFSTCDVCQNTLATVITSTVLYCHSDGVSKVRLKGQQSKSGPSNGDDLMTASTEIFFSPSLF